MTWVNFKGVRDGPEFEAVLSHYGFDSHASGKGQVKVHCPFHDDSNPSCGINLAKKVFHCFSCQAKGNVLDFVARMEGFDPSDTRELRKAAIFCLKSMSAKGSKRTPRLTQHLNTPLELPPSLVQVAPQAGLATSRHLTTRRQTR